MPAKNRQELYISSCPLYPVRLFTLYDTAFSFPLPVPAARHDGPDDGSDQGERRDPDKDELKRVQESTRDSCFRITVVPGQVRASRLPDHDENQYDEHA